MKQFPDVSRMVKQKQSNGKYDTSPHLLIDHHCRRRAQKLRAPPAVGRGAGAERSPRRGRGGSRGLAEGAAEHRWRRGRWECLTNVQTRCRNVQTRCRDVKGKGKPPRAAVRAACREPKHGSEDISKPSSACPQTLPACPQTSPARPQTSPACP